MVWFPFGAYIVVRPQVVYCGVAVVVLLGRLVSHKIGNLRIFVQGVW